MVQEAGKVIGGIPLFAGFGQAELDGFLRIFQPVSYAAGAPLVRQGQPADGAFIIESGDAEVITALPGGGESPVAKLGPGAVLGEMALLERGTRSATVIARSPVAAHFIERDGFRMLLAQRNRAAFTIQGRITLTLCQRLRELNVKIVARDTSRGAAPATREPGVPGGRRGACEFDWRGFLPMLPLFHRYSAAELDELTSLAQVMELASGETLFRHGDPADACHVIVRGAIEIAGAGNGQRHRIGILGPGRLCGTLALIEGQKHSMSAVARENAVLLEIGKAAFERLCRGNDRLAARFQEAISQELLQALARTNNHLTRLVSQALIRGGKVDDLQQALGAQDCRAA